MRKLLLDLPARNPALGFPEAAEAIARIISQSAPQFAVGIFGGWGSGKTTLMQAIERELDHRRTVPVRFSAWRYEKEDHLIVPLLDTIRDALDQVSPHGQAGDLARRTATIIGHVIRSIITGMTVSAGAPGAINASFDANKALAAARGADADTAGPGSFYHASFQALRAAFADLVGSRSDPHLRIVVFVDDLDRCMPENALQVLESMKLFFDLPGFVFVVGLDREVVEHAIDVRYARAGFAAADGTASRHVTGAEYIKKIFQLPYRVAPVARDDLVRFVRAAWNEGEVDEEQRTELRDVVVPHLFFLVGDSSVNPREIKRYINAYAMLMEVDRGLDRRAVLTLQTIAFREEWRLANDALLAYEDVFVDALKRRVNGEATALTDLDPAFANLPDDLLEYVSPQEVGHALFEVGPLRPYLSSGEAARSTQDGKMLDAVRAAGTVRRILQRDAAEIQRESETVRGLHQALSLVESAARSRSGPVVSAILEDVVALRLALEPSGGLSTQTEIDASRVRDGRLKQVADDLARRVLRLYRQGDVMTGPSATT